MTSVSRWRRVLGVLALVACSKAAWAQTPAPSAQPSAEPEPWFPPAAECAPACGQGFVCVNGACVSACHPPCSANERCNAEAKCELVEAGPASPPPPVVGVKPEQPPEEKPKVASTEWQTPAKKPTSLPYRHDGFFFRFAIGGAYSSASGSIDMLDGFGSSSERRFDITGGGVTYQLAMGGTLSNGLVIGGLAHTTLAWSPTYELENGAEVEGGSLTQGVVGPFVDYYIDPAAGFHLQFAAGLALVILDGDDPDRRFPNGDIASLNALGIVAGTGYEVFVGREFAMGLLGTFQFAAGNLRGQQASELGDIVSMAFGALLSVTHH